jgi:hypothetical protein
MYLPYFLVLCLHLLHGNREGIVIFSALYLHDQYVIMQWGLITGTSYASLVPRILVWELREK